MICDVFSSQRFGGNPLAVLPDATGLTDIQMQQVAREFNFSESTFVFPPESGHTRKVRIFTPAREVPFAGHPNIGTAFALARTGEFGDFEDQLQVVFEEAAGLVKVSIERRGDDRLWCELAAPQSLGLGPVVMPELAAAALSLEVPDICLSVHPPQVAGVGLPFLIVELKSQQALQSASFNMKVMETLEDKGLPADILLYVRASGDVDINARMFAPIDGVPEDPATGSANCALAALLTDLEAAENGEFRWRISQGVEMGRPSLLEARTVKSEGKVSETCIGGDCVMVAEGEIELG
jgi:trans-2,3-dihydro-3-hydroxyanthranilate isomerase